MPKRLANRRSENKQEGTALEVTGAKIKILSLTLTKHGKGPIDLENKCKLKQGTI